MAAAAAAAAATVAQEEGKGENVGGKATLDVETGQGSIPANRRPSWSGSDMDPSNLLRFRAQTELDQRSFATEAMERAAQRLKHSFLTRAVSGLEGRIEEWQMYVEGLESPQGHDQYTKYFFRHLSKPFDCLCMVVILLNVGFVVHTTNAERSNPAKEQDACITVTNLGFATFYAFELLVRMITQRAYFFFGPTKYWHLFDFILVLTSFTVETGIGFLRALRILRAAKIIRFYKLLKILGLSDLEFMVNCLTGSVRMLFWCMVMTTFFTFLFSVFFVQAIAVHLQQEGATAIELDNFSRWFNSVQEGMLTLLMIATGGADWKEIYDAIRPAGWIASAAVLFYILLFTIAVWNVVTSAFVDRALKLAKPSDDALISEARRQAIQDAKELRSLFRKMDLDCSGQLNEEEFCACMARPEFDRFLQSRGLDIKEIKVFFKMLAQNEANVDIDHVVNSCMRVRGFATTIDLQTMRYELRRMQKIMMKNLCMLQQHLEDPSGAVVRPEHPAIVER